MKRISLIIAALALGGTVAGCGAANDFNPDVVAQAADKTASAGGAKMSMTMTADGQNLRGNGFVDTKGKAARITMALPQNAGSMTTVFVDRAIYMRFPPALQKGVPGGKAWVKLDLDRFGKKSGIDFAALQSTGSSDPSQSLEQLRGAGDVKKVGTEKVRGTDTTHYSATVDLRKAVDRAPAAQRDAVRRTIDKLIKQSGQRTVPMDVWLDKAGRVRRMKFTQTPQGKRIDATMELYDFGTREAIKAPPSSETADITDLAAKQAGG
jgi:hypothetical protein